MDKENKTETMNVNSLTFSSSLLIGLSTVSVLLLVLLIFLSYQTYQLNQKVVELESQSSGTSSLNTTIPTTTGTVRVNNPQVQDWDFDTFNPFEDMRKMHERINKMFGNSWSRLHSIPQFQALMDDDGFSPSIDIEETDKEYLITVNVPGAEKSNIKASIEGNLLSITGTTSTSSSHQDSQGTSLSKERFVGQFSRTISLPRKLDPENMNTEYKDGVLTIRVLKSSGRNL